jgi:hypothetical protein
MMKKRINKNERAGLSVLEYIIVVIAVMLTLIAMRPYINNALVGQYRKTGEGLGFLRQYDPKDTRVCIQDEAGAWYSRRCFENQLAQGAVAVPGVTNDSDNLLKVNNVSLNSIKEACQAPCAGVE